MICDWRVAINDLRLASCDECFAIDELRLMICDWQVAINDMRLTSRDQ